MSFVWLTAAALLLVAGTAAAGSVPRVDLRIEERLLIGLVVDVLLGSAATYLLALAGGLDIATVLGGSAITTLALAAVSWPWRREARARWRGEWDRFAGASERRHALVVGAILVASIAVFAALFAHAMSVDGAGNLSAGFETVWADWSQHLTTASSFATAHNLPPQNPLFSGQDLRYPFLPDFQSATLVTLGLTPAVALALPGAVLATAIVMLIVLLAVRLGSGLGAGVIAATITLVGGGLGFTGVLADACLHHGFSAAQCTWTGFAARPATTLSVIAGTLHDVPGILAAQPRAYDGLLTPAAQQPLPDQQWYTPLFAWWLPQRTILYGFAGALAVLILVLAAVRNGRRPYESFALGGVVLGLMPLVHVHTLIAMAIVCAVLAVFWPHRGWLVTLGAAVLVAGPHLLTLLGGPHGSVAAGNVFPTVEPGWMYQAVASRPALSAGSLVVGLAELVWTVFIPAYWGFWILNTGVAVPVCALVTIAVLSSRWRGGAGNLARHLVGPFPRDLLRVLLACMAVFGVANLVVFQSWDWDNTKLFAYWYLGAALLIGTLVTRWWRRWWRGIAAACLLSSVLLTGVVVLVRLLPWTPTQQAVGGPYITASAADVRLAARVAASTAANAVFLTEGKPNDPLLTLAGRTAVMGYYGWLWSYGTDFGSRVGDVRTMLEGCHSAPRSSCPVFALLRRYGVGYAEIDDRVTDAGIFDSQVDLRWWAAQGFPVVARTDHVTVYDVRQAR